MRTKRTAWAAWSLCGAIILSILFATVKGWMDAGAQQDVSKFGESIIWAFIPIIFAIVGALIISKQPRNTIGWLVMLPALAVALLSLAQLELSGVTSAPSSPSLAVWLAASLGNTLWVLLVFPLFFIALLFPTGKPLTPRWRWVVAYGVGLIAFFYSIAIFGERIGPDLDMFGVSWTIQNPIGFISQETLDVIFGVWWGVALAILALCSVICLVLRYRRANLVERAQLKWLIAACSFFAVSYVPSIATNGEASGILGDVLNVFFAIGVFGFPISIGIAILRYRLFDIDIIIRRTLTYALVTALLLFVFFGSVIVLQQVFAGLTGSGQNELVTVLSTLAIAALFVPVRNWVQNRIDRRFNRRRYDAQQILSDFANTVRDETDLEKLTARLMQVVDETMQPRSVELWLVKEGRRSKNKG